MTKSLPFYTWKLFEMFRKENKTKVTFFLLNEFICCTPPNIKRETMSEIIAEKVYTNNTNKSAFGSQEENLLLRQKEHN